MQRFRQDSLELRRWLFESALPLWWLIGADHSHGGFHDRISQSGVAADLPKRARVQARQIFVYAEAGRCGWPGDWQKAVTHGVDFLFKAYRRDDGLFRSRVETDGTVSEDSFDLYDQAFVLFSLAAAYRARGGDREMLKEAYALLDAMERQLQHPTAGFENSQDRQSPLRANPHMHLLEACLAWIEAGISPRFAELAIEIVVLAKTKFLDRSIGAIAEYFDADWEPFGNPDRSVFEPGHQFEWAYLLHLAKRYLGLDSASIIPGLVTFGQEHGIRNGRVILAVNRSGKLIDSKARLWGQTERLRAMTAFVNDASLPFQGIAVEAMEESADALRQHLDVPLRGLWREQVTVKGEWIDEAAPASSLYHIVTGLSFALQEGEGAVSRWKR